MTEEGERMERNKGEEHKEGEELARGRKGRHGVIMACVVM